MTSPPPRRLIGAVVALAAALLLGAAGAASSGYYLWSLADVLGGADRSAVFTHSGFLLFGILLSGSGVAFLRLLSAWGPARALLSRDALRAWTWALGVAGGLTAVGGLALAGWHVLALGAR